MEKEQNYVAPEVEVLEVKIEAGFAQSGGSYPNPFGGDEIPW